MRRSTATWAPHVRGATPELFHRPDLSGFARRARGGARPRTTRTRCSSSPRSTARSWARSTRGCSARREGAEYAFTRDLFAPRLRIEYLATAAAHRRAGVGTALVEAAEAWGREQGATVAELTTYHRSPLAMPFWTERAGYAERSVNLRKEL